MGGWNFPSHYFSTAVKTEESRETFAKAVVAFTKAHSLDGIDIDWEHPCSEPRQNSI